MLWVVNNYDSLKKLGTAPYFYIPKIQTPQEALIFEKLLAGVEKMIGVAAGTFKIKMLYEEGNAGRFLPVIAWVLRRRLLGTNVGPLGLFGQFDRNVEGRSAGSVSRSADDRHGDAEHDRVSALQCPDDADGRYEEWRTDATPRPSAAWRR